MSQGQSQALGSAFQQVFMRTVFARVLYHSRHTSFSSLAMTGGRRSSPSQTAKGRPEMSTVTSARASSMGTLP